MFDFASEAPDFALAVVLATAAFEAGSLRGFAASYRLVVAYEVVVPVVSLVAPAA